jgi:signal transduction histidine kinase
MEVKRKTFKAAVIVMLAGFISVLHYGAIHGHLGLHIIHRELYFIPILLAGFWFGLKTGLITSLSVSLIYAPHVFLYQDAHGAFITVAIQILMFNLVAALIGWLVDRQRRVHAKAISNENLIVLGRAAALIGHEMNDLLQALKSLTSRSKGLHCTDVDKDFEVEMIRLKSMVEVLSSFAPPETSHLISSNLNSIIHDQIADYADAAKKRGVKLAVELDVNGCPSRVDTGKLGWILGHLIQNALEISSNGQSILIKSRRRGDVCQIDVQDQGPGIAQEHLSKMFTPFFTTKEEGCGLSLAASKKILNALGGDIQVTNNKGLGAAFTITVPRENAGLPIEEDALSAASLMTRSP